MKSKEHRLQNHQDPTSMKFLDVQVCRQVWASEAVCDRETPLPVDHQEQEPPMGQIDISLSGDIFWRTSYNIGQNRYLSIPS